MDFNTFKDNLPEEQDEYGNTFSEDQAKAIPKFKQFLESNSKICTISGFAGTGKTFLLKHLLTKVHKRASYVSAPTHKAVRNVEKFTGKKGMTLHSAHGLRPNTDILNFDINNPQYEPRAKHKLADVPLFVIDECSQINNGLGKLNETRASMYNTKILYVGDEFQLPPIGERISSTFVHNNVIRLNQIIRQKTDNPLLDLFPIIRRDIMTNGRRIIEELNNTPMRINDKGEGYIVLGDAQFNELAERKFKENGLQSRYLAWHKDTVGEYTKRIRNSIINSDDIIVNGDILTAYNTIMSEFYEPIVINSIDYTVKSVKPRTNDFGFSIFEVILESEFNETTQSMQILNHKDNETLTKYRNLLDHYHFRASTSTYRFRVQYWREFNEFKDMTLTMIDIPIKSARYPVKKDLDYAHGLTIHKSQGSTYESVFLDINDILFYANGKPVQDTNYTPYAIELRNKLINVGMSRASKIVYIKA